MTLNITVLSDSGIHQSSDFILWDADARAPVSLTSTKIVQVGNPDGFTASVAYAGVGRVAGTDTAGAVVWWLTRFPANTFDELIAVLQSEGSKWLREIKRRNGAMLHHTFVVAAFVDGVAAAAYVSNFEAPRGPKNAVPSDDLQVSRVVATGDPVVLTTGCVQPSVSRQQRHVLERIVRKHRHDWGRIRVAMAELNRVASRSGGSACPVSEDSVARSFDRHGVGASDGMAPGAASKIVMDGEDVGALLHKFASSIFPDGYQVGSSTTGSSAAAAADPILCAPIISTYARSPDFELTELDGGPGARGVARVTSSSRVTAGEGTAQHHGPPLPVRWPEDGAVDFLPGLGGITGQALSVSADGVIVGGVEDPERRMVAVRWDAEGALNRLVESAVSHSQATHSNDAGDVVGWVSIHESGGEQVHHRPAYWKPDGTLRVLRALPDDCEWGLAVGVNSGSQVLVNAWTGRQFMSVLWDGDEVGALSPSEQGVTGVGILDCGDVVGSVRTPDGPLGVVWSSATGTWTELGRPPGWLVTAVSANGHVAGRVEIDGWGRPWVRAPGEDAVVVQHYAYHHHEVNGVNDAGNAAGRASCDHGSHALTWAKTGS